MHRLRNTYIIFTSDNGFFYGQHRLVGGKFLAYEPSTHLPLLIRGPGDQAGQRNGPAGQPTSTSRRRSSNWPGSSPTTASTARSLFPFAHDPSLLTRRPVLFESFVRPATSKKTAAPGPRRRSRAGLRRRREHERRQGATASIVAPPKNYYGILLGPYKYIEWPDGEKELYDMETDPNELNNIVREPNFFPIRDFLHRELERLETCHARSAAKSPKPAADPAGTVENSSTKRNSAKGNGNGKRRKKNAKRSTSTNRRPAGRLLVQAGASTQRKPMWLVEVSSASAWRAAGR